MGIVREEPLEVSTQSGDQFMEVGIHLWQRLGHLFPATKLCTPLSAETPKEPRAKLSLEVRSWGCRLQRYSCYTWECIRFKIPYSVSIFGMQDPF